MSLKDSREGFMGEQTIEKRCKYIVISQIKKFISILFLKSAVCNVL